MDGNSLISSTMVVASLEKEVIPTAAMICGLRGLVDGECTKLVLRECCIPCTIEVCL